MAELAQIVVDMNPWIQGTSFQRKRSKIKQMAAMTTIYSARKGQEAS